MMATPSSRYTAVAIVLHWVMAGGILALFAIGLLMVHGNLDPSGMFALYQLHKSIGITILLAAVLRLLWRFTHKPPALPATMKPHEAAAARAGHGVLYAMLFGLPLSGWAMVSVSVLGIPTVLYGLVPWPDLPVLSQLANKAPVEDALKIVHAWGAYALMAFVALHVAAALRHQFILRDSLILRMLPPFSRRHRNSPS